MPTPKQKRASKLVEEGRTLGEAMVKAGYSPNTAKAPTKLTRSKGWQKLMEKKLPDSKLLKIHNQALEATKIISSHTEPDYAVPDIPTRLKAVELGYKVKGRLGGKTIAQQFNVGGDMGVQFILDE